MNTIPNRTTKTGRNEPCPCGSGNKFKKCHGGGTPPKLTPGRLDAQKLKTLPHKKCMVPQSMANECKRGTIAAHTVSRSGSLGAIERDGCVYSYKVSQQSLTKTGGKLLPQLVGWKVASTFPGFCGHHDKQLFAPLEDAAFTGSREQCFLLAYRAIVWELYAKSASKNQNSLRHALAYKDAGLREFIDLFNSGVELGLRDATGNKTIYDAILESKDWSKVRGVLFEFDNIFPIQCTGAFFPHADVDGIFVQEVDENTKRPDAICVMSFAANMRSYFLLCWVEQDQAACEAFANALRAKPATHVAPILGSMLLQSIENCHFSPNWYEGLSEQGKNWCNSQMANLGHLGGQGGTPASFANRDYFAGINVTLVRDI